MTNIIHIYDTDSIKLNSTAQAN